VKIAYLDPALEELSKMDKPLQRFFLKHADKIASMPPRRHLRFGLPFNVENVTKQARLVYELEKDMRFKYCLLFKNHGAKASS